MAGSPPEKHGRCRASPEEMLANAAGVSNAAIVLGAVGLAAVAICSQTGKIWHKKTVLGRNGELGKCDSMERWETAVSAEPTRQPVTSPLNFGPKLPSDCKHSIRGATKTSKTNTKTPKDGLLIPSLPFALLLKRFVVFPCSWHLLCPVSQNYQRFLFETSGTGPWLHLGSNPSSKSIELFVRMEFQPSMDNATLRTKTCKTAHDEPARDTQREDQDIHL